MNFPYGIRHYCNTVNAEIYFLPSKLGMKILDAVAAIEQDEESGLSPTLDQIMERVGYYYSTPILNLLEDFVRDGFLTLSADSWYPTSKGLEFASI